MKITINRDNLIPNDNWQILHKVRAIIENDVGEFIITKESGKCIFPGGKREDGETNIEAIKREIKEETGIEFSEDDFIEKLELETLYKDAYDFRTDSIRPRYTNTIYYYVKCNQDIDTSKMTLTEDEKSQGFRIAFVSQERLLELLMEDHSTAKNGTIFDEENKIVIDNVLDEYLDHINHTR